VCVAKSVGELEFAGDRKRVGELDARAFCRGVADRASKHASIMKQDAGGFPGVRAFVLSAFDHHGHRLARSPGGGNLDFAAQLRSQPSASEAGFCGKLDILLVDARAFGRGVPRKYARILIFNVESLIFNFYALVVGSIGKAR
jgi:hypothetical protein